MPLIPLQCAGFATGFATAVWVGYRLLLDPVLVTRYTHLTLLDEVHGQLQVEESRMTAELSELESRVRRSNQQLQQQQQPSRKS